MSYRDEVMADNPVGYWRLGETSGAVAQDETANNIDGTYVNTPTLGVAGAISGNTAVSFASASSEYISVPHNAVLNTADVVSIEFWFKLATTTSIQTFVMKGTSAYRVYYNSASNKIGFERNDSGTIVETSVTVTDTSSWHHFVATKNGATSKLYLDGVDRTGVVTNQTLLNNSTALLWAAMVGITNYFNGSLDELAIYSTALSAARVAAHFNPPLGDLIGAVGI